MKGLIAVPPERAVGDVLNIFRDVTQKQLSAESEMTAAAAAVVLVNSEASMVSLVEKIVVPDSLMFTVGMPEEEAVVSDARTPVRVIAKGIRIVSLAVPVVMAVVSSDSAMARTTGKVAAGT